VVAEHQLLFIEHNIVFLLLQKHVLVSVGM
jgi:hypothetical protein